MVFDHISVFDALYDLLLEYNSPTWYSSHIEKAINRTKRYIDQYASHASMYHKQYAAAKLNIEDAESLLKNKQFAGVVKRSAEWKELKDFLKKFDIEAACQGEEPQAEAIIRACFKEVDKFILIISSK